MKFLLFPKNRLIKLFFSALLVYFIFFLTTNSFSLKKQKRILVLHSYHIGLSWTQKIIQGIESTLNKAKTEGLEFKIDYEYMDTKRFVDTSFYEMLYKLYKHKSRKIYYDVIISVDDNALHFLLEYRDKIYGEVPVVFCGVNYYSESLLKGYKLYTGVVEAFDVKSTIEIALKLHPETNEFVFIGDNSTSAIKNKKAVQKEEPEFKKRNINFTYYNDGDIMRYARDLQKLKAGSIIVAMLFNRDNNDKFYTYEESFEIYTKYVEVPIYTFWDFYIGKGALGGRIISGVAQGEEAAKKALQILKGEKTQYIPILNESPNRYMFDYHILKFFNINVNKLPEDTIIINKPHEFIDLFRKHKYLILSIFGFIIFLLFVILTLSFNILKRRKVEKQLLETNISYDRFVPHAFLDLLQKDSITDVILGDHIQKEMTILFSDIRFFTTLSESMSPEENFNFLNSYLNKVSPLIRDNNGFIDKYIGDAIMALFPQHAEDALIAAIEMQKSVIDYNLDRAKVGYKPITIGIGLHLGKLMLGTVGEEKRMEGTVISDAVNLASRLESLTKLFGAGIIISEQILLELDERKSKYIYRYLGQGSVKGKKETVQLYEVIDGNNNRITELKMKTKKLFEEGVEFYSAKDFRQSIDKFEKVLKINPKDKAAIHYLNRSKYYMKYEAPQYLDGFDSLNI